MTLPTRYDFRESEPRLYSLWQAKGVFRCRPDKRKKPYCIVIPPPNVTGTLHMGHALNNTLQDILIRFRRLQGRSTLYQPGTDHAGIATQFVVERELAKEGKSRIKVGREKFLEAAWKWKETYEQRIINQLKKLGVSCDWERSRFTMDEQYTTAVMAAFKKLFDKGLIYKGKYLVNWCPRCRTAISDLEVVRKNERGKLYHIRYPLKDEKNKYINVATTRPETMLGDTACAVHPDDKRYSHLVGKIVALPFVDRDIPVIADEFVQADFGTGIVKITPAHDFNDYECARRHGLPFISIFDEGAVINENGGQFRGMDRKESRKAVLEELEKRGLVAKQEDHDIPIGRCSRCGEILEPFLSDQWFLRMKDLAKKCLNVIENGYVGFFPVESRWEKLAVQWLKEIHDWCISRQLWWGHRIPVYECNKCFKYYCYTDEKKDRCEECPGLLVQVEDVLDTWFSSALWPFATLGWPEKTKELEYFYPTTVLVTARDIINLWVTRMICMGLEFMGEAPFSDVYIHSTVLTLEGKRHSKSKGVGFDPLDIIDEYGADSLRYILCRKTTGNQDLRIDKPPKDSSILEARNFVTKIYNAARFLMRRLDGRKSRLNIELKPADLTSIEDKWIVSSLNTAIEECTDLLDSYDFGDYAKRIYEFVWDYYCDYYIELSKSRNGSFTDKALAVVLVDVLKLLHPVIPFATEEIWQGLKKHVKLDSELIATSAWPRVKKGLQVEGEEEVFEGIISCVKAVRGIRSRFNIPLKEPLEIVVDREPRSKELARITASLANVTKVSVSSDLDRRDSIVEILPDCRVCILLGGKIDSAKEKERLEKKKEELEDRIKNLNGRLQNKSFVDNAPEEVVNESRKNLKELKEQLAEYEELMTRLR